MEEIIKTYIINLLELRETKLKCINLGVNQSRETRVELEMIKKAKKLVNNKL